MARVVQLPRHATHHTSQYSLSSFIKITILIVSCNFCVVQSCGDTVAYATDFAPPTPAPLLACAYHKKIFDKTETNNIQILKSRSCLHWPMSDTLNNNLVSISLFGVK